MKKTIFTLIFLAVSSLNCVMADTDGSMMAHNKKSAVSIGVKGGFNSTMFFANEFYIGGTKVSNIQNNYKVGYFASFFLRANFKHHFIQPEISYNVNKASVLINLHSDNLAIAPVNGLVKSKMISFDVPLLYGYKFIDKHPYGMALFIGPKVAWTWDKHTHIDYSGFNQVDINEKIKPLNYSAVFGLAVNISNIFCDFRYEVGLNKISDAISFDKNATQAPHNQMELVYERRRNVLSFSLGVIF